MLLEKYKSCSENGSTTGVFFERSTHKQDSLRYHLKPRPRHIQVGNNYAAEAPEAPNITRGRWWRGHLDDLWSHPIGRPDNGFLESATPE